MLPSAIRTESGLENYFSFYRQHIIGQQQHFESPFGIRRIIYADWTASGRAYQPIEDYLQQEILPFTGNTHTATTVTGSLMSAAYDEAKAIIKKHVHAQDDDILLFCGSGMTAAVNKLQRLLGLRRQNIGSIDKKRQPVVFVTHMEHHSNHISWLETNATVEIISSDENGNTDLAHLQFLLEQYKHREYKIAAVTACSNVTGICTPYHEIATLMHACNGVCFVDFACAAPYATINMHPAEEEARLDAIYFSGHKFLGGPGTPGVLIFNKQLYHNKVPDQPGGGTVVYTNPWGMHVYTEDIAQREDGGTPPFIQGIKAAMCIRLKEEMGIARMQKREEELLALIFPGLSAIKRVHILEAAVTKRLGVISFIVEGAHYNLVVRLLNDRFGIQARGGCSCAGTYGHLLLHVEQPASYAILNSILAGDLARKPGWIRLSVHPTMTSAEINFILDAIDMTVANIAMWAKDYAYDSRSNEYYSTGEINRELHRIGDWFDAARWTAG
ncbi:aminotransferase class V-fold PLP-dependent enzyme [Chitinophaga sp. Mgbs1]|uniref:Aminotransferase class V-fold PLP-dependent enzyme n=1 Tax=Chitinophaga solisilvae TaxID=1233460 RepID=A0A433WPJ9_9BACT|nr:aminotransferase class V-fold PLP-dependent enzyme [Chitinophaga solisilvae]